MPEKRKNKGHEDPLVRVAVAPNEPLAKMWAEVLENEGIHSVVKSRSLRASMYVPSLLAACEIHVLASQAESAKEALAPFLGDD